MTGDELTVDRVKNNTTHSNVRNDDIDNISFENQQKFLQTCKSSKSSVHGREGTLTEDPVPSTSTEKNKEIEAMNSENLRNDSGDETDPEDIFCAPTQKITCNRSMKLPPVTTDEDDLEDFICAPTQKFVFSDNGNSHQDQLTNFSRESEAEIKLSETIKTPTTKIGKVDFTLLNQSDTDLNETGPEDVICLPTQESRRMTNEMEINETPERDAIVKIQSTQKPHMNGTIDETPERDTSSIKVQKGTRLSKDSLKKSDLESETQADSDTDELFCAPTQKINFSGINKAVEQEGTSTTIFSQPTQLLDTNINKLSGDSCNTLHREKEKVQSVSFSQPTQNFNEIANKNTLENEKEAYKLADDNTSSISILEEKEIQNTLFSQPTQVFNEVSKKNTSENKVTHEKVDSVNRGSPSVLNNSTDETNSGISVKDIQENPDVDIASIATQKMENWGNKKHEDKTEGVGNSGRVCPIKTPTFSESNLDCRNFSERKEAEEEETQPLSNSKTVQNSNKNLKTIDDSGNNVCIRLLSLKDIDAVHSLSSEEDEEISKIFSKDKSQRDVAGQSEEPKCRINNTDSDHDLLNKHRLVPPEGDNKIDLSLDAELCLPQSQEVIDTLKELENKGAYPKPVKWQFEADSGDSMSSPIISMKKTYKSVQKSTLATDHLSSLSDRIKPLDEITGSVKENSSNSRQKSKKKQKGCVAKEKQKEHILPSQCIDLTSPSKSENLNSNSNSATRRSMRERRKTWKVAETNDNVSTYSNKTTNNSVRQKYCRTNHDSELHNLNGNSSMNDTPKRNYSVCVKPLVSEKDNAPLEVIKPETNQNGTITSNVVKIKPNSGDLNPDKCPVTPSTKQCKSTEKISQTKRSPPKTSKASERKRRNEAVCADNVSVVCEKESKGGNEQDVNSPVIMLRKLSRNVTSNSSPNCQVEDISLVKEAECVSQKRDRRREVKASEMSDTCIKLTRRQTTQKLNNKGKHVSSEIKDKEESNRNDRHSVPENSLNNACDESPRSDEKKISTRKKNSKNEHNMENSNLKSEVACTNNVSMVCEIESKGGNEKDVNSPVIMLRKLSRNITSNSIGNCHQVEDVSLGKETECVSHKHDCKRELKPSEVSDTCIKSTRKKTTYTLNNKGKHVSSEIKEQEESNRSDRHSASENSLNDACDVSPSSVDKKPSARKKNSKIEYSMEKSNLKNEVTDTNLRSVNSVDEEVAMSSKDENLINESKMPRKRRKDASSLIDCVSQMKVATENSEIGKNNAQEKLLNTDSGTPVSLESKKDSTDKDSDKYFHADNVNVRKSRMPKSGSLLKNKSVSEEQQDSSKILDEVNQTETPKRKRRVTSSLTENDDQRIKITAEHIQNHTQNASKILFEDSTKSDKKTSPKIHENPKQIVAGDKSPKKRRATRRTKLSLEKEENYTSEVTNDLNEIETPTKRRKVTSGTESYESQMETSTQPTIMRNEIEHEDTNGRPSRKRRTVLGQTTSAVENVNRETVSLKSTNPMHENKNIPEKVTRKRKAVDEIFIKNVEEDQKEIQKTTVSKNESMVRLGTLTENNKVKKAKKTSPLVRNEEDGSAKHTTKAESSVETSVKSPRSSHRLSVRPQKAGYQVLFTGLCDSKLQAAVHNLGGKIMEKPDDCNVLVTDKVRRTYKFLCVMGQGKPIVSPEWLIKSQKSGKFLDPWDFLLSDSENEAKFKFCLKESLIHCGESKLLSGFTVAVTPNVRPPPPEMKGIIESCGGTYVEAARKLPENSFIVSCNEDRKIWPKLKSLGAPVVGTEVLLLGVLQQKLDLKSHVLV